MCWCKQEIEEFCVKNNIPVKKCGKVVVAKDEDEVKVLAQLYERGIENGCNMS